LEAATAGAPPPRRRLLLPTPQGVRERR